MSRNGERKGVPRTRSILLVFVIAVGLFLGLLGSVLPQAISESRDLATKIPDYAEKVWHRADDWVKNPPEFVRRYLKFLAHEDSAASRPDAAASATGSIDCRAAAGP